MMLQLRLARLTSSSFDSPERVAAECKPDLVFAARLSPCNLGERVSGAHGRSRGIHEFLRCAIDGWKVFICLRAQTFAGCLRDGRQLGWCRTMLNLP